MTKLTHLNTHGEAHMVDVSGKADTARTALAQSTKGIVGLYLLWYSG